MMFCSIDESCDSKVRSERSWLDGASAFERILCIKDYIIIYF